MKNKKHSEETKHKISESKIGRKVSEETKKKMSDTKQNVSEETRNKLRKAKKGISMRKINCPYCNKIGGISQMRQWHFENCKDKK